MSMQGGEGKKMVKCCPRSCWMTPYVHFFSFFRVNNVIRNLFLAFPEKKLRLEVQVKITFTLFQTQVATGKIHQLKSVNLSVMKFFQYKINKLKGIHCILWIIDQKFRVLSMTLNVEKSLWKVRFCHFLTDCIHFLHIIQ